MDQLWQPLMKIADAMRRIHFGMHQIQIWLPAGELNPDMAEELDGSNLYGIPILVYADIDKPVVVMEIT